MEREAYQRYHKMACRLGYNEPGIKRQFQSLLCLMAWAQKPMDTLTLADLDNFISSLKAAYSELDGHRRRMCEMDGLPHSWSAQIHCAVSCIISAFSPA